MGVLESNWSRVAGDAKRLRPHPACESTQLKPEDNLNSWHSCSPMHYMVRNLGYNLLVYSQVLALSNRRRDFNVTQAILCFRMRVGWSCWTLYMISSFGNTDSKGNRCAAHIHINILNNWFIIYIYIPYSSCWPASSACFHCKKSPLCIFLLASYKLTILRARATLRYCEKNVPR